MDRDTHAKRPVLTTEALFALWATELASYSRHKERLLQYLHDAGHVVWIKELELVALNPQWLTNSLIGRLLQPAEWLEEDFQAEQGRLTHFQMAALLGDIDLELAIPLLQYFELIASVHSGQGQPQVLVPSLLRPEARQDPSRYLQEAADSTVRLMACRVLALREAKTDLMSPAVLPRLQAQVAVEMDGGASQLELGYRSFSKTSLVGGVHFRVVLWQDEVTDSIAIVVWTTQEASVSARDILSQQLDHCCKQVYELNHANAPATSLETYIVTLPRLKQCQTEAAALFQVKKLVSVEQLRAGSKNVLLDRSSCCAALLLPESYSSRLPDLLTQDRMPGRSLHMWSLLPPLNEHRLGSQATNHPTTGTASNIAEQAEGAIMLSYSWGARATDGSHPQQEMAKRVKVRWCNDRPILYS